MSVTTAKTKTCIHCGTGFRATTHRPDFCCAGCEFVHGLIKDQGLSQYYELQDGANFPVKSVVFQQRDYTWLAQLAEISNGALDLDLQGISCIGCVWLIERIFEKKNGALSIHVDPTLGRLNLRFSTGFDAVAFAREIQSFGYLVGPVTEGGKRTNRSLIIRLGLCAALAMNGMLFTLPVYLGMDPGFEFAALFNKVAFICGTLSMLTGGSYFFTRTWHSLRHGVLHIDLPISLGLIAAYSGSIVAWMHGSANFVYFDFISVFTFLMLVGRWTQEVAVNANRNRLLDSTLRIAHPAAGERFSVEPGQIVPVKAVLHSEAATLGVEWISGESESRTARAGQLVPSGAVNLSTTPLTLEAAENWHNSVLARMLDATPQTDRRARGMERFIRIYLIAVLIIAAAALVWWWNAGPLAALQVVTSILVVSCPCAVGVALPLAEELAAAKARRAGVLVREASLWARLPRVDTIVFDKTGTLTLETLALKNPESLTELDSESRTILSAMVAENLHPMASCLREQLMAMRCSSLALPDSKEHTGLGIEVTHCGCNYRLGKPGWAADADGDCIFARDGVALAAFRFGDELREDAADEFARLRATGHALHILSGDRPAKVARMAADLGLAEAHAHGALTPDEKAAHLRALGPQRTLMIGDGANDSLAFNTALCTGTPAIDRGLLERRADFYFLGRGLRGIRALIAIARRRAIAASAVIAFAITYNLAAISLCIVGKMSPLLAAILMPLSGFATIAIVLGVLRKPEA